MADNSPSPFTGLTDAEAEEFHKYYLQGLFMFVGIAVVAHFLVWMWRPWIPGPDGYASISDTVNQYASVVLPLVG